MPVCAPTPMIAKTSTTLEIPANASKACDARYLLSSICVARMAAGMIEMAIKIGCEK